MCTYYIHCGLLCLCKSDCTIMDWVMQSIIVVQNDFEQPLHIHTHPYSY